MTTLFTILLLLGVGAGIYFLTKRKKDAGNQSGNGSSSTDDTTQE